jgi:hypothetical protein
VLRSRLASRRQCFCRPQQLDLAGPIEWAVVGWVMRLRSSRRFFIKKARAARSGTVLGCFAPLSMTVRQRVCRGTQAVQETTPR